ncbi:MAG: MBOAT family protein, partial [Bacteroidales bacterium]|nr:MBOAT family protein [Bacteroidales bacterium]
LSTWFRDYVYISLGGNRVVKWRWYYNLFITFLVSGLWHGAEWSFVIWGALHGFYLIFAIWTVKIRDKANRRFGISRFPGLYKSTQIIVTFLLVYFAWIFFRANNLHDAFMIIGNTFRFGDYTSLNLFAFKADFSIALISICLLLTVEYFEEYRALYGKLKLSLPRFWKWAILTVVIYLILILGIWKEADFLYFQF